MELTVDPEEERLFEALRRGLAHSGETAVVRVAGGWVRDRLLGRASSDIDLVVDGLSELQYADAVKRGLLALRDAHHQSGASDGPAVTVGTIGHIKSNPALGKHVAVATVCLLDRDIDICCLRSEQMVRDRGRGRGSLPACQRLTVCVLPGHPRDAEHRCHAARLYRQCALLQSRLSSSRGLVWEGTQRDRPSNVAGADTAADGIVRACRASRTSKREYYVRPRMHEIRSRTMRCVRFEVSGWRASWASRWRRS